MDFLKILIELITAFFKDKQITHKPTSPEKISFFRNYDVLLKAQSQIGTKEIVGTKDNPVVVEYLAWGGSKSNSAKFKDETAWCAGFVGWCLEKVGMESTNSLMARSYEKWGVSSRSAPLPGDVVTFWRGSLQAGTGHVGFFLKQAGGFVYVLGGNQSNEVNIARYSMDRLTDIRRSSKAGIYTEDQKLKLRELAENVLAGKKIDTSGAVV